MEKNSVLLTVLEDNEGLLRLLADELVRSGLDVSANIWSITRDLSFGATATALASCKAWVIAGRDFSSPHILKNLSLAALCAQADHGVNFPILISYDGTPPSTDALPTPLRGAIPVKNGIGAKTAVQAKTFKISLPDYRIRPYDLNRLGLWMEIGTRDQPWKGAFFASGEKDSEKGHPTSQGVGPCGSIPEKCTLHSPIRGVQLEVQGIACEGWGVKNELSRAISYYVRLDGAPDVLCFGPFPEEDAADLYTVTLV